MVPIRWSLAVLLACAMGMAAAEELDVITLKDGRVFEGHYNDITGVMRTMQGPVKVAVKIAPGDVVGRSTKTIPDADGAPPAATVPAHPPAKHGEAADRAKRVDDLVARQEVVKELTEATDEHRTVQTAIDKDEADVKEVPLAIKDADQEMADTRDQLDRDIVREAQITAANPGSQAETDARMQHDHDSATLAKLQAKELALKKRLVEIDDELPGLRVKFRDSLKRQTDAQAALDALGASPADDPLGTITEPSATPAKPAGK